MTRTDTLTEDRVTIDGITYAPFCMGANVHGAGDVYCLTKIGRSGKPVKANRPAIRKPDGSWSLRPWAR